MGDREAVLHASIADPSQSYHRACPGTREQGPDYFDLRHPERGPFKALGGHVVGEGDLIIAKRETDYELWNRIVPDDRGEETDPAIKRPEREIHAVLNEAALNDSP
ncbi:MAG TPA: hypothetical protein VKB09_03255 [Thermomicrobiales bacterium]|nr:hypothetical protein [Thermomicrobiales bacterium]